MPPSPTASPPARTARSGPLPRLCVRAARVSDAEGLYELVRDAGAGLTNLPPDRDALAERLAGSIAEIDAADPGMARPMMLVLEADGRIAGTGMVVSRVGSDWPFYSYKMSRVTQHSRQLRRTVTSRVLNLVNDFEGFAEVGGLFLDKNLRGVKAGRLIARSRYLFIAEHRYWFGDYIVAELRGVQAADGSSPFWEAVGRPFYDMDFEAADKLNAIEGNQFIADLGPKYPIYVNLLSAEAQASIGVPHADGRHAYELLIEEGYRDEDYVDIFDGGPTIEATINELRAVRDCRVAQVARIGGATLETGIESLVSNGHGHQFRCARGQVSAVGDDAIITSGLAEDLRVQVGDKVRHVAF